MVDQTNAHIRSAARQSPDVAAADAKRLLDDPAFKRGVERVRNGLLRELEDLKHDGQPETDAFEREVCRSLRTLHALVRAVSTGVQMNVLRTGGFRVQGLDDE